MGVQLSCLTMLLIAVVTTVLAGLVAGSGRVECPKGSYYVLGECHLCPKGSYQSRPGMDYCRRCPRGSYADIQGASECKECPKNHLTYFTSSESKSDCHGPELTVTMSDGSVVIYTTEVSLLNVRYDTAKVTRGRWTMVDDGASPPRIRVATPAVTEEFCYTGHGADYQGKADRTEYGIECLKWSERGAGQPEHNYCRNTDKSGFKEPYCFIDGDLDPRAVKCTVPKCVWDEECKSTPSGGSYVGPKTTTERGYECQVWSKDYPHPHGYNDVGDHNMCRNPGNNETAPWCYTMALTFPIWDYCIIRECDKEKDPVYNYARQY